MGFQDISVFISAVPLKSTSSFAFQNSKSCISLASSAAQRYPVTAWRWSAFIWSEAKLAQSYGLHSFALWSNFTEYKIWQPKMFLFHSKSLFKVLLVPLFHESATISGFFLPCAQLTVETVTLKNNRSRNSTAYNLKPKKLELNFSEHCEILEKRQLQKFPVLLIFAAYYKYARKIIQSV